MKASNNHNNILFRLDKKSISHRELNNINNINKYIYYYFRSNDIIISKLKLSDPKHQTNENIRDDDYNGKFLFPMKDFVSFGTYHQSIYFM